MGKGVGVGASVGDLGKNVGEDDEDNDSEHEGESDGNGGGEGANINSSTEEEASNIRYEAGQAVEALKPPHHPHTPRTWHRGTVLQSRWRMGVQYEVQFRDRAVVWVREKDVREWRRQRGG